MPNRLAGATSPYLLQHRDNPVDWREWGGEALAEAQRRDVPVVLSIGYAACHWCHVMAHESFENPRIAAQMNRDFVCIKVDREERPDIDAIYMQALHMLGQPGGWPLTMFLTPEGEPFWGGTYFPPEPRYGRPSFPQVLAHVSGLWEAERAKLLGNRDALREALAELGRPAAGALPAPALAGRAARELAERFDTVLGGLLGAPKFPQAPMLDLLWNEALAAGDDVLRRRVLHTLGRIAQGGIYDHLGGGFARYSVDAYWLVPHFEKMLYDNAQLLRLLGQAWAATGEPLYRERARETVAWLQREMRVGDAFAASLDADSEGEEGRFYVWTADEIDRLLGADAAAFRQAYGVVEQGNWEHVNVLNRLHEPGLPADAEAPLLARCRARLLEARERRPRPERDDKVLADWNGLMIAALAESSGTCGEPAWLELAERAFAWVVARLGDGPRLHHSWREDRRLPAAFLDDYALMTLAAVRLFERTGDSAYLARAEGWIATLDASYARAEGGYFTTHADADDVIVRAMAGPDGPLPSGNAALAQALARLHALTGEPGYAARAEAILRSFAGELDIHPHGCAGLLVALTLLAEPVQIVVTDGPGRDALLAVAGSTPVADLVVHPLRGDRTLPEAHPAAGKRMVDGRAAAYICLGRSCQAPITDPERLRQAMAGLRRAG
ncbi:MAG: thioredoxin domain-containing protein [Geminicoccaceae bacterium]